MGGVGHWVGSQGGFISGNAQSSSRSVVVGLGQVTLSGSLG